MDLAAVFVQWPRWKRIQFFESPPAEQKTAKPVTTYSWSFSRSSVEMLYFVNVIVWTSCLFTYFFKQIVLAFSYFFKCNSNYNMLQTTPTVDFPRELT